ncbi:MAG: hypothetical protein AB7E47_05865 [Desulfovibrionaceae bacterium]
MGQEHDPATVWRAQDLYVVDRLSMREVSERVDVAESTLWRWAAKYGWSGKREDLAKTESEIRVKTVEARHKMLLALIDSKDPQVGFAVASLERLALEQAKAARAGEALASRGELPQREILTPADAAAALEEALTLKLRMALADPASLDVKAVANIRSALAMAAEMRAQAGGGVRDEAPRGMARRTREEIERMLGYKV